MSARQLDKISALRKDYYRVEGRGPFKNIKTRISPRQQEHVLWKWREDRTASGRMGERAFLFCNLLSTTFKRRFLYVKGTRNFDKIRHLGQFGRVWSPRSCQLLSRSRFLPQSFRLLSCWQTTSLGKFLRQLSGCRCFFDHKHPHLLNFHCILLLHLQTRAVTCVYV